METAFYMKPLIKPIVKPKGFIFLRRKEKDYVPDEPETRCLRALHPLPGISE